MLLITAYSEVDIAVKAIKEGAFDFICKPWDIDKLIASLHAALKLRESERKLKKLEGNQQLLMQDSMSRPDAFFWVLRQRWRRFF